MSLIVGVAVFLIVFWVLRKARLGEKFSRMVDAPRRRYYVDKTRDEEADEHPPASDG
jgi:hypothetical protein